MTNRAVEDFLIVALDGSAEQARIWAREMQGHAKWVKVGMTLFYAAGPSIVTEMKELGYRVFIDLKLHDIPAQVRGAAYSLGSLGADLITVHAGGGEDMIRQAVFGSAEGAMAAGYVAPRVIAVTVLTSMSDEVLASVGVTLGMNAQVERLAGVAKVAGAHGCVCSPKEVGIVSAVLDEGALIVTPGVRLGFDEANDQVRVLGPAEAIVAGSTHLVVGRPIISAPDKAGKIKEYFEAIKEGLAR